MTAPPPFSDDYAATTYEELCIEISDRYLGETGDLVRAHARAVLALRDAPAVERARLAAFLTDHAATLDAFVQGSSPTEFVAYLIGLDGPPPPAPPTEPETRLLAALADAGAAVEAMPHDERFRRVDEALAVLDLEPGENAGSHVRAFLVGVMVVAHERRLAAEFAGEAHR